MRLFADVLTAAGVRIGNGPLMQVRSASVRRALDGAGDISLEVPSTDPRVAELQHKRRLVLYAEQFGKTREIGRSIIDVIEKSSSGSERRLSISGPDILGELKYSNTLPGRKVSGQTISQAVASLTDITLEWGWTGWTSEASGTSNLINARYDAVSVLKALQSLSQQQGLHLRLGTGKRIEVGAFGLAVGASSGDTRGLTLLKADIEHPDLIYNDDIALIESCRLHSDSEDLITWLLPLAGGQNVDSALTLQYSNRTSDRYTIQTMAGPDGRTLHFLRNIYAEAKYGTIAKVGTYKELSPLDNSDSSIQAASNATFDAAAATLDRYTEPQQTYSLRLKKCQKTILPGDKVRIHYHGDIEAEQRDGSIRYTYEEIDGEFWVIEVSESFGQDGLTVDLTVSNIDRYRQDVEQVIIGGLEQITIQGMVVQPSFNARDRGPYSEDIDPTHPFNVVLPIRDTTFELDRCILRVDTKPFRSNAKTVTAHTHMIIRSSDGTSPGALALRTFSILEQTTGTIYHFQAQADVGATAKFFDAQPSGTNTLDYGVYDDTLYPTGISILVDGVAVVTGLDPSGVGVAAEFNIRDVLVNAGGGLRQNHTLTISCTGGQGKVLIQLEIYEKITPFKLG